MKKQNGLTVGSMTYGEKPSSDYEINRFWNIVRNTRAIIEEQRKQGDNWKWYWIPRDNSLKGIEPDSFCLAVGCWYSYGCWGCGTPYYTFYTNGKHPIWKS